MADGSIPQRWSNYRPSKALWFWSCVVCIAATLIVGFTWGGWVTGATAQNMAQKAAAEGQTELAAALCVNRFVASPEAKATFAKLKEASSWDRGDIISKGGWAKISGVKDDLSGVADACAQQIAAMKALPAAAKASTAKASVEENG